ncbi:MAG: sigma-70 family RNA polymerase sigma factor [Myxococcota bacterium]
MPVPTGEGPLQDELRIRRALRGDPETIQHLIRRLAPVIQARTRRAIARRKANVDEADLIQEVWVALLGNGGATLRKFDPARGATLEGYVGMITSREVGNRLRERAAKKRGGDITRIHGEVADMADEEKNPESIVATQDLAERLGKHLFRVLPPRGQLIFRYAFTDKLPATEIAKILRVDVQVIYNWQHRIRKAAREFLDAQERDTPTPTPT